MGRNRKFSMMVAAVAAVAAFAAVGPGPARAQTYEGMRSVNEWAVEFQRIVVAFITPMQQLPGPPQAEMGRTERLAWAGATRAWAANAQSAFAAARADLQRLPPPPVAPETMSDRLRTAIAGSRARLQEALDSGDRIASAYLELADAVERNQMNRVASIRVTAIEAALVTTRMFQDINTTQATAMVEGNPQRPLAMSYAQSYEALWAYLNYKRGIMVGEADARAATADAIENAAREMRALVAMGRADLIAAQAQLNNPAATAGLDPRLLPRLQRVASTFPASFVREEEIALEFETAARVLRDPRSLVEIEPELDHSFEVFSARDAERVGDIQQRTAIMMAP